MTQPYDETIVLSRQELGDVVYALEQAIRQVRTNVGVFDMAHTLMRMCPLRDRLDTLYSNPLHFEAEPTN